MSEQASVIDPFAPPAPAQDPFAPAPVKTIDVPATIEHLKLVETAPAPDPFARPSGMAAVGDVFAAIVPERPAEEIDPFAVAPDPVASIDDGGDIVTTDQLDVIKLLSDRKGVPFEVRSAELSEKAAQDLIQLLDALPYPTSYPNDGAPAAEVDPFAVVPCPDEREDCAVLHKTRDVVGGESITARELSDIILDAAHAPAAEEVIMWDEAEKARRRKLIEDSFFHYRTVYHILQGLAAKRKAIDEQLSLKIKPLLDKLDETKKTVAAYEAGIREQLVDFSTHTGDKSFNEYLSTKAFEDIVIVDRAAATTWAQTNFPAAISQVPDEGMIIKHLEQLPKDAPLPAWAEKKTGFTPQISKRFTPPTEPDPQVEVTV